MEAVDAAVSPADSQGPTKDYSRWSENASKGLAAAAATATTETKVELEAVGGVSGSEEVVNTESSGVATSLPLRLHEGPTGTIRTTQENVIGVVGSSVKTGPKGNSVTRSTYNSLVGSRRLETPALIVQNARSISTTLRREEEVMDREAYLMLLMERQFRRHDPMHGFDRTKQDYVYYNHRSKGCYIPVDKPMDMPILTYNHMFDYGDGSRFKGDGGKARANPCVIDPLKGTFKSLTRGSYKSAIYSKWNGDKASTQRNNTTSSFPHRQKSPRTVSVDLARSLQISDLHIKPFRKDVVVEDVIAADTRSIAKSLDGISSVVTQGKVMWEEVPEKLRRSCINEQSRRTVTLESVSASHWGTGAHMGGTQDSRYQAPEPCCFVDPARSYPQEEEEHRRRRQQEGVGGGRGIEQKQRAGAEQETTKREQVAFTDHAEQVLLGFMDHVHPPPLPQDSPPYCGHAGTQSVGGRGEVPGEGASSAHQRHDREEGQTQEEEQRKPEERDETREGGPDSYLKADRAVLLPPVALAQLREAAWFSPEISHRPRPPKTPLVSRLCLQKDLLPYETSRLHFRRNYDVRDAEPPQGSVRWLSVKGIR